MFNKDVYDLTNAQNSIWLTEQYLKGTSIGNISGIIYIDQKVDVLKLTTSIREFVNRNDSMRTRIFVEDGTPKQFFDDTIDFEIPMHQLASKKEVDVLAKKIASTPFNLINSNLFSFDIFTFPKGDGGIVVSIHHIIGDAWTSGLIVSGIMDIYESLLNTNQLNDYTKVSYIDYINSEKNYLNSPKFEKDAEFWNSIFDSIPLVAELPSKKRLTR
mgnify:CR=1 FL=1